MIHTKGVEGGEALLDDEMAGDERSSLKSLGLLLMHRIGRYLNCGNKCRNSRWRVYVNGLERD